MAERIQSIYPADVAQNPKEVVFDCIPNHAQYGGSDYSTAVRVERGITGITLAKAKEIAANDPNIDYFFIVTGGRMILVCDPSQQYDDANDPLHLVTSENFIFDNGQFGNGNVRVFNHGDVVFFTHDWKNDPNRGGEWFGTAPGLADLYFVKR